MTRSELKALAQEKFNEFVEQEFFDSLTTRDITIFMAMIASKAAQYAADEEDF